LAGFLEIGFMAWAICTGQPLLVWVGPDSVSCNASGDAAQSPELNWSLWNDQWNSRP
jgi:hypothetical protein